MARKSISKQYNATSTLAKFHISDKPLRLIRGPVGSGKSVAMVMECVRRAQETPYGEDGVRRSRAVAVRNTLQQLKTTNLITVQEWLRPITNFKVSDATIQIRFTPADGHPVECDVLLLPLDTPENVQRLLSLELTFAWVSEFRELPLDIVQAVFSRCGRFPSRANVKDYWYGLFGETNSFSEDTDWYTFLELEKPDNVDYFIQPGAFEPNAENRENLPVRYYEDLMETNSETWVDQYIHNKIGPSLSGQAVFAKSFDHEFHTAGALIPDVSRPIVIGLDVGRNPAAVIGQLDVRGRMCVLSSLFAENVGVELFLSQHLRPHLTARFDGAARFFIAMDPSARNRSQIGEESVLDAIRRLGFSAVLAPTNAIAPRLRAVERFMTLAVSGGPGFLIDKKHNLDLLRALMHDYRYTRDRKGTLGEVPEKKHPASDICFVPGTPVLTAVGYRPIECIRAGDKVVTPNGLALVQATATRYAPEVMTVALSNGVVLTCTPDHPFIMADGCVVEARSLQYLDVLYDLEEDPWLRMVNSGLESADTVVLPVTDTSGTSEKNEASLCTAMSGSTTTEPSPTGTQSTTSTTIQPTTPSAILNVYLLASTPADTHSNELMKEPLDRSQMKPGVELRSGTVVPQGCDGMRSTGGIAGLIERSKPTHVPGVSRSTRLNGEHEKEGFAPRLVKEWQEKLQASMTSLERVSYVRGSFKPISTGRLKPALKVAATSICPISKRGFPVVSLQVAVDGVYFVGDALVSNCDALQYLCLSVNSPVIARAVAGPPIRRPTPSVAGWT